MGARKELKKQQEQAEREKEEYKKKADELTGQEALLKAGEKAKQTSQNIANEGARQTLKTAKSLGLNAAQAAQAGAQTVADTYAQNYTGERANLYGANADRLGAQSNVLANQLNSVNLAQQKLQQQNNLVGSIFGGLGKTAQAIGSVFGSDERIKDYVALEIDPIEEFKKIKPIEYRYKEGSVADDGGAKHIGATAQDLEKSPLTEHTVIEGKDGTKAVKTDELVQVHTATLAEIAERISKLEERLEGVNG